MTVIDNDLGWKDITRKCRQLNNRQIKAGVLEGAGRYKTGISVADVATYNHFGTQHIPSRPFLAIASDTNKGWSKWVTTEVGKMMDAPANSVDSGLNAIGTIVKNDIKKVIGSGKLAPNKPSTVRIKGHDMPLIGLTYKLMDSIDYEVE